MTSSTMPRLVPDRVVLTAHFGPGHPLNQVALDRCQGTHRQRGQRGACGPCWEYVIRHDATTAAELGLPATPPPVDPYDVDQVAVKRALAGDYPGRMSHGDRLAVAAALVCQGHGPGQVSELLRTNCETARALLAELELRADRDHVREVA